MVKQLNVQSKTVGPGGARNGCHGGDAVMPIPGPLDWPVASGSPHSAPERLQQKATFVEENNASFAFEALFLTAAIRRGANEQSPARPFRGPAVRGSEDSNQAGGAPSVRSSHDRRHRKSVGSDPAPKDQSIPTARSPNDEFLETAPQSIETAADRITSQPARDVVWDAACRRDATLFSNARPKKHLSLQPQLRPSTTFPSRKAELRFVDELPAIRGFLLVSCTKYSKSPIAIPLST